MLFDSLCVDVVETQDLMPSWHAIWTYSILSLSLYFCPHVILHEQVTIRHVCILLCIQYTHLQADEPEKTPVFFPKMVSWPLHMWAITGGHCVSRSAQTLLTRLLCTASSLGPFRAYCMFATFTQQNILLTQPVAHLLLGAASAALLACRGRWHNDVNRQEVQVYEALSLSIHIGLNNLLAPWQEQDFCKDRKKLVAFRTPSLGYVAFLNPQELLTSEKLFFSPGWGHMFLTRNMRKEI